MGVLHSNEGTMHDQPGVWKAEVACLLSPMHCLAALKCSALLHMLGGSPQDALAAAGHILQGASGLRVRAQ